VNYDLPDEVRIESDGPVRIITLNRPERLNAVNNTVHVAMTEVWRQIERDGAARAVLVTGAGRAFSAGGDQDTVQNELSDTTGGGRRRHMTLGRELVHDMANLSVPVVAAINGPAVGLGLTMALLCDIRFMAEDAWIADPHISAVGLACGDGAAVIWPLLTSLSRAKEFLFTGERIPANDAERYGLVNRVVPADRLYADALQFTHKLASMPALALQATKRALNMHLQRAAVGVLDYALAMEDVTMDDPAHKAMAAKYVKPSAG
jgi:enoyl-CoA hydratase